MSTLLVFSNGPLAGQRILVETDLLLGREDAEVVVDDPEVSRHHAVLRNTTQGLQIEDLGSRNGTFVNDVQIPTATTLVSGDTVRIGQTLFHIELDAAGETVIASTLGATVVAARPARQRVDPEGVVSAASVETTPAPAPVPPPTAEATPAAAPSTPPIAAQRPAPGAAPPQFAAAAAPRRAPARVASRQAPAVMITFLIIIATGIALAAYFATR